MKANIQFDITVLEKMIETYNVNIDMFQKMFQQFGREETGNKLAELVSTRRLIAAMIENDGKTFEDNGNHRNVFFDSMLYTACAGADTSWW